MRYLILLLSFLIVDRTSAQNNSQCTELANKYYGAIPGCTYNSTVSCETWTSSCGKGWIKSHGTPQIKSFIDGKTAYYYYFWNVNSGYGEGMYKAYSFEAGMAYKIYLGLQSSQTSGKILVYAANGLTEGGGECGEAVPTGSSINKQLIYEYIPENNDWAYPSITFTANGNYSQIWIYPLSTSTNNIQYDAAVSTVYVCKDPCSTSLTYNTGVVPTGEKKAGTIVAGTNGGSGTVTIAANQSTTLVAYKSITLVPNFNAVPGSGSLYLKTEPCPSSRKNWPDTIGVPNFPIVPTYEGNVSPATHFPDKEQNSYSGNQSNWTTYYGNGQIVISRNAVTSSQGNVIVYDMAGKEITRKSFREGQKEIVIQSQFKQKNIYIVRIITKQETYSKKIYIQN